MSFIVYRANSSQYLSKNFLKKEAATLCQIPHVLGYLGPDDDPTQITSPLIMITSSQSQLTSPRIQDALQNTQLVIHPNSGHDNIHGLLEKKTTSTNLAIIVGNPLRAQAVTEYILSCLFQHFSKLPNHHQWDHTRSWPLRSLLAGKKILIFGYGHIGTKLTKVLSALDGNVYVYDPYKRHTHQASDFTWLDSFHECCNLQADAVILCCSLNKKNHGMIHTNFLESQKSNWLLINSARGKLINQGQLWDYAQRHAHFHAYLDVFDPEPHQPSHVCIPNIHQTSHIAGCHDQLEEQMIYFTNKVITDFIHNSENFPQKYHDQLLNNRINNAGFIF